MHGDCCVYREWRREEDFLDHWLQTADLVVEHLGGAWRPNYSCDDAARWRRDLALQEGTLDALTFDAAVELNGQNGMLSSLRVYLRSSARLVIVRVTPDIPFAHVLR